MSQAAPNSCNTAHMLHKARNDLVFYRKHLPTPVLSILKASRVVLLDAQEDEPLITSVNEM